MDHNPEMWTTTLCLLHVYDSTTLKGHYVTRISSEILELHSYSKRESFIDFFFKENYCNYFIPGKALENIDK